jgi:hypothetical protein
LLPNDAPISNFAKYVGVTKIAAAAASKALMAKV